MCRKRATELLPDLCSELLNQNEKTLHPGGQTGQNYLIRMNPFASDRQFRVFSPFFNFHSRRNPKPGTQKSKNTDAGRKYSP